MAKILTPLVGLMLLSASCGDSARPAATGTARTGFASLHRAPTVPAEQCRSTPPTIRQGVRGNVIELACPGTPCGKPDTPIDAGTVLAYRENSLIGTARTACGAFAIELSPGDYTFKTEWDAGESCPPRSVSVKPSVVSSVLISC